MILPPGHSYPSFCYPTLLLVLDSPSQEHADFVKCRTSLPTNDSIPRHHGDKVDLETDSRTSFTSLNGPEVEPDADIDPEAELLLP